MTAFICEWGSCASTPTIYLLYGCLEQHTGEEILCKQHSELWARTVPSLRCHCGEPIDIFQPVPVRTIHRTWLDTLLRDQNARRAGKYLSNVGVPTTVNTRKPSGSYGVLPKSGGGMIFTPQGPRKNGKFKTMKDLQEHYKYPERRDRAH